MSVKFIIYWFPMIALAFANATLREIVFMKHFNELKAHQLSTVTLMVLCLVYVMLVYNRLDLTSTRQAIRLGLVWVVFTVIFEFSLGVILHHSWQRMFEQYKISTGHIWLVFLIWLCLLPVLFYSWKH